MGKEKPKIAFYWCASCGGCDESFLDLAEDILDLVEKIDIVFWPVALDYKRKDLEALPDQSILMTMINGSLRTSEQEEMALLLRRKSKILIAYGTCAHLGGIPSLANQFEREKILEYLYKSAPSVVNKENVLPKIQYDEKGHKVTLPEFRNVVRSLDQVVDVDYYLPGCSPPPKLLKKAFSLLLSQELPSKGSVLAPDIALCYECPRIESKPKDLSIAEFKRLHHTQPAPEKCFLAQGIACIGPATRGGCEARCIQGNMPCTGCFGPTSRVRDQGAKILSALASSVKAKSEEDIDRALSGIPDPVGSFYRYGLAKSLLRVKRIESNNSVESKNNGVEK